MIIGIDVSMLVYTGSGVSTYTYNLVKSLIKHDKENEYKLFYSSLRRPDNFYYLEEFTKLGAKVYNYRFPPRVLKYWWNKANIVPIELLVGKVDVFHSSDFLRPPLLRAKGITTIHDLTWKIYPEFHTEDIVRAHEQKIKKTIQNKDIIIVDSNNTKRDLLKYYPQAKNNEIHTIYLGIDERFRVIKNSSEVKKVLKKYKVNSSTNFLLYVGAIEPRKNLDTCIKVFAQLIKIKKFSDYKFLIVGRAGWKNEEIFSLIEKLKLGDKIKFVGFVEDIDLPYFYNAAQLLLYLSKYEGFGLPPLESLACGTKVLAARNSSIEELLDEQYLVNINRDKIILEKLCKLLESKSLVNSKYYRDTYSWSKYTREFLKIIR